MNLFRQQKFSIRKFNVGIFSALIATVTFISTNPTTASAAEQNQPAQNQPAQPADANTQPNANAGAQANPAAQPAAPANQGQPAAQPANQGGQANPAGGAAQPAGQGNQADPNNAAQAQPGNQAAPANQAGQGNNQATPNNNATPANQTQPANAPAAVQPAAPVAANAQTQDPNASNTGEGSINTTLTFDDPAISTDENRQDPTVTVTDKVNGYSLINNGKIGFVNSELRRSDMFDKNNPQNYQAKGNVAALGRVNANDSTDHGNFNGISKTVNVKPDSELIINFTTMQTNSKQGATNLVIKDAKKNTELATVNVAKTGTAHLFKVPTDADRLDLQFIPDNTAVADASRITTNKDGYKYYSFIDNVGLFSGSHLYVKNRDLAPKATNNKEYTINTEIGNNGNFGASLKADQFKYEVTLPQGVTYVNDSLTTTFPNGNEDSTVLKNMTVNYDQNANKVTFTSQGVTTARGTHTKEVLFPDKSLKLSYKVNVANIDTPKNIDFNEKLTYRTASDVVINNAQPEVTLTADPFSVAVEMNKDALQQQVNSQVDNSHYTTASIAEYNKLKQQADTILNEDANHVETANRASQADIDGLVTKLQAALIDNQAAIAELDTKAQEKVTAAQQSKKVTQDEVAALVTKINNDKNNAIAEINKQTTSQGVTTEKDNGIAVLEQDVITPTVKPQAKQDIIQAVTTRKQQIKKSNASLQDEKDVANDKIGKIETKAIKDIDAATTNAQVEAIKTKAINDINQTTPATTAKAAALEEFDEVVQAQIDQAPLNPDTTNEEVAEAIERINAAKVSGVKAIEATTTAQDLERVKNEEISKIENITDSTQTKMDAYNEVKQAATARKAQNATVSNATNEEVAEADAAVDAAQKQGLHDIQVVKSKQEVADTKSKVLDKINAIQTQAKVKPAADTEVENAYNTRKQEIQNSNASTTEEKEAAYTELDAKKQEARTNLDAANTNSDVTTAKDNGIAAINQVQAATTKKSDAKAEIAQKASERKTAIEAMNDSTTEEQQAAKDKVDQAVVTANADIDNAAANADVDNAKTTNEATIAAITPDANVKPAAKQAIADKVQAQETAIDANNGSTTEEKEAAKQQVQTEKTAADAAIDAAHSNAEVEAAKNAEIAKIEAIQPATTTKDNAKEAIATKANERKTAIAQTQDITAEEIAAANADVDNAVTQANSNIEAANSQNDVDQAKTTGETSIDQVTPTVNKKATARNEITTILNNKLQEIQATPDATDEEKQAAIQQLATAVTDAKNNITAATDDNGVDQAKDAGKNSIQSTQPATAVKSNAKNDVDQAVTTQNQAIDNTTGATTEEKNAAKDLVLKAKEKAYLDILNAQTTNDVTQIKDQAVTDIQGITADTTIKDVAKDELATKANEQKALIAQTADATTEEKEQANQQVDAQLTQGNQNIENAQSIDDVNTAKENAIQAIDPIQASTDVKTNARAELLTEMQNKITEILSDNTTTNEEKGKDIEPVRATYEEGLNNINTANTTGDVTTAKDTAVQKVQQLHANPVKKPAGKTALDQAAADRKTQIEQTPNASQQEINDAKQEVDAALNQAKTNVDQSSTNEYVDNAVKEGKAKINAVKTFSEYKKDALAKIADAYNAKVNEADNSNASTSSEIAEAKQKLAELKQTADQNVNQATSKDDIEVQIHNDLDNINDYTIPTGKKETATTDLYAYADQKKNNISADTNATQDEKQQAIKQVDQNVQTALESINNGVDNGDVDDALTQGKAAIDAIQVDATVKPKANQAIEVKAEDTKESIDQSDQLTAEEKTEALAMIKQITDQAKQGITDATTTAEVEKAKAQGLEAFDNIQIDSTEKQKAIEELETALDQIEAGVNVDADATTEEKEAFTNALEDILSKATEDISDQTTNAEIATVKNSALEQLKAQRINPEVKKNALEAIREVVNKQIEIIKNADADASAKEIARTDLGRYFDRFADKLDKTQTNAEVAELQNVTIPAIEAIVPQNDPDANDTNNGIDNNDATANSNANATPENTGQPNVSETTDNGKADASPTTPNNSDAATGETTATSATDDANDKPQANNNSSVDASTNSPTMDNDVTSKPEVESTNNGTTDKPVTETDNATPAESTTNNNSTTTATNENAPTGSTATAPTTASTEAASSADSKDNASVNDSKQNAEVNNSAESQSTNGKVAQPKSENKAKAEKDGRDSTNQSMVESTTETLPSADITEPNVPSNTSKDKEESTTNQTDAGQLKSETNVASNEADKSPSKADTEVSNKPSTSASSEAKDKMTSTNVSQKDDTATADTNDTQTSVGPVANNKAKDMQTNDTQKSVGSAANNKATQNDGANASPATVSNGSNSANQDMLNVTKPEENKANAKSAQQGKVNKAKQQAKTLPDTGMSHNDDLPYAELALGAGMAFLIRRFTKKDQQTEE
ncbi:putative surface anchored protein [Staphylococcus aureus]|uniref:SasC/FmtB family protein n=1 Tax=Staphylococcus aureus TaxID=1280 RepID=UPI000E07BCA1|nr:SasC/FmtB family protein [Staphylococcus aureus]SUL05243.1 putative surface anchored protein [Staphylococcus aureus]